MEFRAHAKFVRMSPAKLRPIADVVRGKDVQSAVNWLKTYATQRAVPVRKAVESAAANARQQGNHEMRDLVVKSICVDQGPMFRYFKPGAMGRAQPQRRRLSHIVVVLENV